MSKVDIVLLSGGSGKRLWPLSNGVRSKQFLRILTAPDGKKESMIQRVARQISESEIDASISVSTNKLQVDSIINQLGNSVQVIAEPAMRDTFSAVALADTYLLKTKGRDENDIVVIMPSDPYTEIGYFKTIAKMVESLKNGVAELVLMGIKPTSPASNFGYIIPYGDGHVKGVSKFVEKPQEDIARILIAEGALWNGGVFAFRLGFLKKYIEKYIEQKSFDYVRDNYDKLPKISFDYEVVENANSIAVVEFEGQWEDLGAWESLSARINSTVGNVVLADSENTTVVNELSVPIVAMNLKNTIVVASSDGILVSDKNSASNVKNYVDNIQVRPMFEERRWGEYRVLEKHKFPDGREHLVKLLKLSDGKHISYQRHKMRDEVWTFINGRGLFVLDGVVREVCAGEVVQIRAGQMHAIKGIKNLEIIEVQLGESLVEDDIERFDYSWDY